MEPRIDPLTPRHGITSVSGERRQRDGAKQAFEDYVDAKMDAYKEERYGGWFGWARWADVSVGIDRFGASAPGGQVLAELGINPDNVAAQARALIGRGEGDEVTVRSPGGARQYEIQVIEFIEDEIAESE